MAKETIEEILSKVGPGKHWETIEELIRWCKGLCKRLGFACYFGGGAFGWKFWELIPMLENEQALKGSTKLSAHEA